MATDVLYMPFIVYQYDPTRDEEQPIARFSLRSDATRFAAAERDLYEGLDFTVRREGEEGR